ncbi:FAD-dependent 5-carboxymethylaminomethyl-2-thiouridine(34) oxidoreductase MnmC [Asticcacaulis sp.]|uniref:FAD-dependent 5-carboxymethylaminomethyl-2-thiouridine(34) oxidoreductase MnmC n=1 Tax=Asticcacaulis sp. TaxID=1872648 RepID=UPI002C442A56|nr:FAD-dependent 5-carboxymethylaminomethyl-2-thiouridine(34) oxidoreductase MnmC [Asticcacaulis sp.]HTM83144.1 FAD-dependent 5-carboxymethylaminomethyl-2-thiouridine(34) oxidoreductase MnmC [Asticcacaulis sp.]
MSSPISSNDPELYFAEDGAPRSGRFGDIYYSLQDGLSESRAVFLTGCHMPDIWAGKSDFALLELGFGTGLNIAAVMALWAQTRPAGGHLHIFSVEGFLMSAVDAGKALAAWPELASFTEALLAQWPKARRGFHYMDFPQWGVRLSLGLMDVRAALTAWEGKADAVFLDGFSPALNPDMWADDVFALIADRTQGGARLATFTVAGFVRRGLQAAGFAVEKCPGFGRKRERLEAVFTGETPSAVTRPKKLAIIGAGIAGCALVYEARQLGLEVDLFESDAVGAGASGNAAALVTPRLDAGDNEISALFADAFAYATALYRRLCPQAIVGEGVQQCVATPKDASRYERIVRQARFAAGDLSLFTAGEAPDMSDAAGISLNTALWVKPSGILQALLGSQAAISGQIAGYRHSDLGYELETAAGTVHAGYDALVFACGDGIFDLADYRARYDLRPVRGQLEIVTDPTPLASALSWGGYAIPLADGFLFGATHEREDRGTEVRAADRGRNLDSLARAMPDRAARIANGPFRSRASIRVMTRDYLPVVGPADDGIYLLTGLGARGFCLAPLLAKALLNHITGVPSALPLIAKNLLDPRRLLRSGSV